MNVREKLKFVFGSTEKIVGKLENAGNQHFLLFSQCFQKASFSRSLKDLTYYHALLFFNDVLERILQKTLSEEEKASILPFSRKVFLPYPEE